MICFLVSWKIIPNYIYESWNKKQPIISSNSDSDPIVDDSYNGKTTDIDIISIFDDKWNRCQANKFYARLKHWWCPGHLQGQG